MWAVKISDYLKNRVGSVGRCKVCLKSVQWAKEKLASHKRFSCPTASGEVNRLFAKRSMGFLASSVSLTLVHGIG